MNLPVEMTFCGSEGLRRRRGDAVAQISPSCAGVVKVEKPIDPSCTRRDAFKKPQESPGSVQAFALPYPSAAPTVEREPLLPKTLERKTPPGAPASLPLGVGLVCGSGSLWGARNVQRAARVVQRVMCSVQCAMCSVQCVMCSVQCDLCHVQRAAFVQRAVCNV